MISADILTSNSRRTNLVFLLRRSNNSVAWATHLCMFQLPRRCVIVHFALREDALPVFEFVHVLVFSALLQVHRMWSIFPCGIHPSSEGTKSSHYWWLVTARRCTTRSPSVGGTTAPPPSKGSLQTLTTRPGVCGCVTGSVEKVLEFSYWLESLQQLQSNNNNNNNCVQLFYLFFVLYLFYI